MAKAEMAFVCDQCGADYLRWQGQCNACNEWNAIKEVRLAPKKGKSKAIGGYSISNGSLVTKISDVSADDVVRFKTNISELDLVLGGGIVPASVTIFTGDPGAGKTTLLSEVAAVCSQTRKTLFNTGEESIGQFSGRAKDRLKLQFNNDNFGISTANTLEDFIAAIESHKAKVVFLDSIAVMASSECNGERGGVAQIKYCAATLNSYCKNNGIDLFIIAHVTKDSEMAGPKMLEHTVDACIHIEVSENFRVLRASKNRFGDIDQAGFFQMTEKGMRSADSPSAMFLTRSDKDYSGLAITCIRDGNRNILLETQALITEASGDKPCRNTIGVNHKRVQMICDVLNKNLKIKMFKDIHINLVGGMKMPETETSLDLSIAAALVSSDKDIPIDRHTCFIGEIALTGEIRPIPNGIPRIKEAAKHGFKTVYIPKKNYHTDMKKIDINTIPIEHVKELNQIIG